MGGLAGAIARKYPIVKEEYVKMVNDFDTREYTLLGDVQIVRVNKSLYVANLFTQYDFGKVGRNTEYSAVINAARKLKSTVGSSHSVYFPYGVGAGLGGGDREIIEKIIGEEFEYYNGNVYFCKLN